jgi:hypothetical protein
MNIASQAFYSLYPFLGTKQLMKNLKSKLAMLAAFAAIGVTFAFAVAPAFVTSASARY